MYLRRNLCPTLYCNIELKNGSGWTQNFSFYYTFIGKYFIVPLTFQGQHEAKMKSLNESAREVEGKKRALEEQVDALNEEITQMKAAEQMHKVKISFKSTESC